VSEKRGFSTLDPEVHRRIASKGGKAAHAKGRAHKFDHEEASIAGRAGVSALRAKLGQHYRTHMAEIGRLGGVARTRARKEREEKAKSETPTL
jgi:uncharacterized protein